MKTFVPVENKHRREWIKYQLKLRGSSFSSIARELNVSRQAVRRVFITPYPKMENAIATKLGLSPQDIWPERYLPNFNTVSSEKKAKDRSRK